MDFSNIQTIYQQINDKWNILYPTLTITWITLQSNPPQDCVQISDGDTCVSYQYGHDLIKICQLAEIDVKKYLASKGSVAPESRAPGCE